MFFTFPPNRTWTVLQTHSLPTHPGTTATSLSRRSPRRPARTVGSSSQQSYRACRSWVRASPSSCRACRREHLTASTGSLSGCTRRRWTPAGGGSTCEVVCGCKSVGTHHLKTVTGILSRLHDDLVRIWALTFRALTFLWENIHACSNRLSHSHSKPRCY